MEIGTTQSGMTSKEIAVNFGSCQKSQTKRATKVIGSLINEAMETLMVLRSASVSARRRDINSAERSCAKKLAGKLSRCEKRRARKSAMERTETQWRKYTLM